MSIQTALRILNGEANFLGLSLQETIEFVKKNGEFVLGGQNSVEAYRLYIRENP